MRNSEAPTLPGVIPHLALNIWSAGCSTGEEVYSLAVLIEELLPDWPQWQISILGTDLNPAALDKARRGIYRDWSFRQTEPRLKSRAFRPVPEGWQIHDAIRKRVSFRRSNLLTDPFPNGTLSNVHLIICRNVFIYFDTATIARILAKFHATLSPKGYLVTGHAELYDQDLQQFEALGFPGSMAYKRQTVVQIDSVPPISAKPIRLPQAEKRPPDIPKADIPQANVPLHLRRTETTLDPATSAAAQYLLAQSCWQQGDMEQAMHHCQMALQPDGEAIAPLYLWAQIAEQLCDRKQAKTLLKKILYLQPTFIPAYLELGTIYAQEGSTNRAQKMYGAAQELLENIPPDTWIDYQGRITADALLTQVIHQALTTP